MREDFALQLNAFKPEIPTVLFNNFYRLEKLPPADAALAMTRPAELAGWSYEPALLERLLQDLATRERKSRIDMPALRADLHVEPPYLQIICTQLFALEEQDNPARQLRLKTYLDQGSAVGLLKKYIDRITSELSYSERRLASQCFSYLITRRGTKIARTAQDLAAELRVAEARLRSILKRLEEARLLRSQSDGQETYYELYHDLFSDSIEQWNERFKARERLKKTVLSVGVLLSAAAAVYLAIDVYLNLTSHHLRLSIKDGPQGQVELYRGHTETLDPLHLQHYLAETGITYQDIEPDQRFPKKSLQNLPLLTSEWAERLPTFERLLYYREHGKISDAMRVAKGLMESSDEARLKTTIGYLSKLKVEKSFDVVSDALSRGDQRLLAQALTFGVKTSAQYSSSAPLLEKSQAAEKFLIGYLRDPSHPRRSEVAALLRTWKTDRAALLLVWLLRSGTAADRREAALALLQLDSAAAHQLLVDNLQLMREDIREDTIKWLGEKGLDSQSVNFFPTLAAASPSVRAELFNALAGMNDKLIGSLRHSRLDDAEIQSRTGQLESYLDDPDEGVAAAVAGVFQFPGSASTLKKLRQRVEHSQKQEHRTKLAMALRQLDPQQEGAEQKYRAYFKAKYDDDIKHWYPWLEKMYCPPLMHVWSSFNPRVLPFLLTETIGDARILILRCIPATLLAGSQGPLRRMTVSVDTDLGLIAMKRLLEQDSTQAIYLASLSADPTTPEAIRLSALKALAEIKADDVPRVATQLVTTHLVRALHDLQAAEPHETAAQALIAWSREASIANLAALLLHPDAAVRTTAVRALLSLRSPQAYGQLFAIIDNAVKSGSHSFDFLDVRQVHPDFSSLYTDRLKALLLPSNRNLGKQEQKAAVSSLDKLARVGLPVEPAVISAALSSADWPIQYQSILTVMQLGDVRWREILAKRLPNEDGSLQDAMISAFVPLARVGDLPTLHDVLGRSPQALEKVDTQVQQQLFRINVSGVTNQKSELNKWLFYDGDNEWQASERRANRAAAGTKVLVDASGPFGRPWDLLGFPEVTRKNSISSRPVDALATALARKKPTQALVRALRDEKDPRADILLLQVLNGDDIDISSVAAEVLGRRRALRAVHPIIQRMLKIPETESVRESFLVALSLLKPDLDSALLPEPLLKNKLYLPLLASMCQKSALHDIGDLRYLAIYQRTDALSFLSGQSWQCSEIVLEKFAEDPSVHVRAAVAAVLGSINAPWAIHRLHSLLVETNVRVKLAAAEALVKVAGDESLPLIRTVVADKETPLLVIDTLFRALQQIGTPEAALVLLQAAVSYDDSVGRRAYRILGDIRATQIVPQLLTQLHAYEADVRTWRNYRDGQQDDAPDKVTGESKKGPQRPNAYTLFELVNTLARLADIDTASALLRHDLAEVREAAALGLALRGSVAVIEKLDVRRARSKDPLFQHAAFRCIDTTLEVIEKIGTEKELSALKDLRQRVQDRDGVVARVDWTIDEMEARIDGQKQAAGAAEK